MEFQAKNGWYSLQLFWKINWTAYKQVPQDTRKVHLEQLNELIHQFDEAEKNQRGSYGFGRVIGHKADFAVMLLHEDVQQIVEWQDKLKRLPIFDQAELTTSYLSVCEVTNYLIEKFTLENPRIQKSLAPKIGEERYFCFYPMSKKREWFTLPISERQRMMASHGRIGASYAETVHHYVTNSVGLDDYEWGVTLWSNDMQEFKNIVYEMRFDEASAVYGIFPWFILGEQLQQDDLTTYFLAGGN